MSGYLIQVKTLFLRPRERESPEDLVYLSVGVDVIPTRLRRESVQELVYLILEKLLFLNQQEYESDQ